MAYTGDAGEKPVRGGVTGPSGFLSGVALSFPSFSFSLPLLVSSFSPSLPFSLSADSFEPYDLPPAPAYAANPPPDANALKAETGAPDDVSRLAAAVFPGVDVVELPKLDVAPNTDPGADPDAPKAEGVPNVGWVVFRGGVVGDEAREKTGAPTPNALVGCALGGLRNGEDELILAPPNAPNPVSSLPKPVGCCMNPANAPVVGAGALLLKGEDDGVVVVLSVFSTAGVGDAFGVVGVAGVVGTVGVVKAEVAFSGVAGGFSSAAGVVAGAGALGAGVGGLLSVAMDSSFGSAFTVTVGSVVLVAGAADGFSDCEVPKPVGPALANAANPPPVEVVLVLKADFAGAGAPNADCPKADCPKAD